MKPIAFPTPRNYGTLIQAHPHVTLWDPHGDIDQYRHDIVARRKKSYKFVRTKGESGSKHPLKESKGLVYRYSIYSFTLGFLHTKGFSKRK